jgi:hypothetical protein
VSTSGRLDLETVQPDSTTHSAKVPTERLGEVEMPVFGVPRSPRTGCVQTVSTLYDLAPACSH